MSEQVNHEVENQKLHEMLKQYREENKRLREQISDLANILVDVEGKMTLQCGTQTMIKPQFHLVVPKNEELRSTLNRLKITAYIYTVESDRGWGPERDDEGRGCARKVVLFDQWNQAARLD